MYPRKGAKNASTPSLIEMRRKRHQTDMRRAHRGRRVLVLALALVVLYALAGFLVAPPIVRAQAERRLTQALGRQTTIGRVRLNPFMLSASIENLEVHDRSGTGVFLGWRRLYVRFDAIESVSGDWVLGRISLEGFHASVAIGRDGSLNFADILAALPKGSDGAGGASRPVRIGSLAVSDAHVDFSDQSLDRPFTSVVGPLSFRLDNFRTAGSTGGSYHFEATSEVGERVRWTGTLAAAPLQSQGAFEVDGVVLSKYAPYLERFSRAQVTDGRLSMRGRYGALFGPGQRSLTLSDAEVHLQGLKVSDRGAAAPAVDIGLFDIAGLQVDVLARKASASSVALRRGRLAVTRNKAGAVNLVELLRVPPGPAMAPAGPGAPAPSVAIGEVSVKEFLIDVLDEATPRPAQLLLSDASVSLRNFSLAPGASMPLAAAFSWGPRGNVNVNGAVVLLPNPSASVDLIVNTLELKPLSPYLEPFVNARIAGGAVSTHSRVHAGLSGGSLSAGFEGDLGLEKFSLVDATRSEPLAGVGGLSLKGVKAEVSPGLALSIREADVNGPYARAVVGMDGLLNLAGVARPGSGNTAAAPPTGASPAANVSIGTVEIAGGELSFADRSVEPNVHLELTALGGSVSGISSLNPGHSDVHLKALVGGSGPVEVSGELDPLSVPRRIGIAVSVKNVDLTPASPYMGKYAGYQLVGGRLNVDTAVRLAGDQLSSTNLVTLDQLTLGSPTASPEATHLPVRLGVALLKDRNGQIVIDLPVEGNLADPEFRIGRVVMRVIGNLLSKAATAPFSLVGSMFGGGGEELGVEDFLPGSSDLLAQEAPRMETLSKALENRPALSLGIEGEFDASADVPALRRVKLEALVRRGVWEERRASDPGEPDPDHIAVSAADRADLIGKLYTRRFVQKPAPAAGAPGAPRASPPEAAPQVTLIQRVEEIVTLGIIRPTPTRAAPPPAPVPAHVQAPVQAATLPPLEQMSAALAESLPVSPAELAGLARARAQRVRDYFINVAHISPDRLVLVPEAAGGPAGKGPRVTLALQ